MSSSYWLCEFYFIGYRLTNIYLAFHFQFRFDDFTIDWIHLEYIYSVFVLCFNLFVQNA